jgi:hypothetical protein
MLFGRAKHVEHGRDFVLLHGLRRAIAVADLGMVCKSGQVSPTRRATLWAAISAKAPQPEQHDDPDGTHLSAATRGREDISSITALVTIGRIPALLLTLMFFPPPMLRPAFVLTLTRLLTAFLTAWTTTVPIPVDLLNGDMLSDR